VKEDIKRALKEETATIGKSVAEGGSYTFYVVVLVAIQVWLETTQACVGPHPCLASDSKPNDGTHLCRSCC
jgi:hypothetical protein